MQGATCSSEAITIHTPAEEPPGAICNFTILPKDTSDMQTAGGGDRTTDPPNALPPQLQPG